jgi:hypothetical protein
MPVYHIVQLRLAHAGHFLGKVLLLSGIYLSLYDELDP